MEDQKKLHKHLSALISNSRLQKGFSTLKEFFRAKNPSIDYQTWLHIESGRRIPATTTLVMMGDMLEIPREEMIIAYCKDKFDDEISRQVIDAFQTKGLFDVGALMHTKDYERSDDYVFTSEQLQAMQQDPRLRLYLIYTFDREHNTNLTRLSHFFQVTKKEVKEVVERLQSLGLVEIDGVNVKKIHQHTTVPITADISAFRKKLLLRTLDLTINSESYISNYHVNISEKSYKKILGLFDFVEANLLKMEKEDQNDFNSFRFQIAIAGSKLCEGSDGNDKQSFRKKGKCSSRSSVSI